MNHDDLLKSIKAFAQSREALGKQAVDAYREPVEYILRSKSKDAEAIERLLEGMPDFCFNDDMLRCIENCAATSLP